MIEEEGITMETRDQVTSQQVFQVKVMTESTTTMADTARIGTMSEEASQQSGISQEHETHPCPRCKCWKDPVICIFTWTQQADDNLTIS